MEEFLTYRSPLLFRLSLHLLSCVCYIIIAMAIIANFLASNIWGIIEYAFVLCIIALIHIKKQFGACLILFIYASIIAMIHYFLSAEFVGWIWHIVSILYWLLYLYGETEYKKTQTS